MVDRYREPSGERGELVDVKCAYCWGRGVDPFGCPGPQSKCGVCGGKGHVRVMTPYVPCAACQGTGKVLGRRLTCTACKGKGVTTVRRPVETCPVCRGTGIQPFAEGSSGSRLPCAQCGGRGLVDKREKTRAPAASRTSRRPEDRLMEGARTPASRAASRPAYASLPDRVAAHIASFPGARSTDVQAIFGLSQSEAEEVLQDLVEKRQIREENDLYQPT